MRQLPDQHRTWCVRYRPSSIYRINNAVSQQRIATAKSPTAIMDQSPHNEMAFLLRISRLRAHAKRLGDCVSICGNFSSLSNRMRVTP